MSYDVFGKSPTILLCILIFFLRIAAMMLGDLDADALRTHPLIAVLFVVYTFGVTIVLLNIL